jgi:hypothetical protein
MIILLEDHEIPLRIGMKSILITSGGVLLALYVFMVDALMVLPKGIEAIREVLPVSFNWPLFLVALVLMAFPGFEITQNIKERGSPSSVER